MTVPLLRDDTTATRLRAALPVLATTLPLALVPLLLDGSRTFTGVATGILLLAGYAAGFNVLLGLSGQLFLAVGALGAVGGYATVLLADRGGLPLALALVVGTFGAAALGRLFSWAGVRRRLDALFTGVLTLAFALGLRSVLLARRELTGGEDGLPLAAVDGTWLDDPSAGYLVVLAAVTLVLAGHRVVVAGPAGWALRALRHDPEAAALAGVDVGAHRVAAGTVGGAVLGLVGGLQAIVDGRVAPQAYDLATVDVAALVVLAVGGLGLWAAPLLGAVALGLLDELVLRNLGPLRLAVEGAVLVVVFATARAGLGTLVRDAVGRALARRRSG